MRRPIIFSRPTNAPPQMNRMLVVSTGVNSWCGCLRPPCGGTLATVPSRIFSSACCTPSPETSRVIDGFSSLRPDLVDLVDVDDAGLRRAHVSIGRLQQLQDDVLDVLADVAGFGERGGVDDRERAHRASWPAFAPAVSCRCQSGRSAKCSTSPVRLRRCAAGSCGRACSGCRRRRQASSWSGAGRSRTHQGTSLTSEGLGNWCGVVEVWVSVRSSSRIELQTATHSSQMYARG